MDNSIVEFEKKKAEMLNYAKAMVNMPLESIVKTTKSKLLQKYDKNQKANVCNLTHNG